MGMRDLIIIVLSVAYFFQFRVVNEQTWITDSLVGFALTLMLVKFFWQWKNSKK